MFQQLTVLGYLGKDPEVRYMPNGDPVCSFSVATSRSWKDKNGERQEETEWFMATVFGKLADICGEYLKKGSLALFTGRIKTEKWEDRDGNTRYTPKFIVENMKMVSTKNDRDGGGERRERRGPDNDASREREASRQQGFDDGGGKPKSPPTGGGFDDMDDDIPF